MILKAYLYILFLAITLTSSCAGDKNNESQIRKGPKEGRDKERVDFASKGLENLNASRKKKDIICQTWDNKEDAADAADADPSSNIEILYRGYCIFSDGSMIKDPRGAMQPGKWSIDDKAKPVSISFSLADGKTETYQVASLKPYDMKLVKKVGDRTTIIRLGSEAIRHTDPKDDPFYITNNAWRFKPARPESDAQIKERLKSCIRFFILFYDQKINAKSDVILFTGLPSCFKWYGGGIYLQKENELQEKWINSFYNEEQAMKAYKLAGKLISLKYDWPKKETNWLKLNVAVLRQMESRIDSL